MSIRRLSPIASRLDIIPSWLVVVILKCKPFIMNFGSHWEGFILLLSRSVSADIGWIYVHEALGLSFIDEFAFPLTPYKLEISRAFSHIIENFTAVGFLFFCTEVVKHTILSECELLRCLWDIGGAFLTFFVCTSNWVDRITDLSPDSIANWCFVKLNIDAIWGFLALLVVKIWSFILGWDSLVRLNIREFRVVVCNIGHS